VNFKAQVGNSGGGRDGFLGECRPRIDLGGGALKRKKRKKQWERLSEKRAGVKFGVCWGECPGQVVRQEESSQGPRTFGEFHLKGARQERWTVSRASVEGWS